jgi:hypothetical protein
MKTKRFLICASTIVITLTIIIGCYLFFTSKPQTGHLDAQKITTAVHAYSTATKSENQPLPPTISLQELIAKGFLKHEDVSAFDGWNVTVSLTANDAYPQSILMTATSSKGDKMVVMTDGSVAQVAK